MKHFIIPDTQTKPGVKLNHLTAAGNYIADKKPDVIIHLGDHWDMHSLSSYDMGKKAAEGARYNEDIEVGIEGMDLLTKAIATAGRGYKPRMVYLMGNHEQRIERHTEAYPYLHGTLSYNDLCLKKFGWEVKDYLKVININGVHYAHYFHPVNSQNAYSGQAPNVLTKVGYSFTQGHRPGLDVAMKPLSNGKTLRGLIAGSFYQHKEKYKGHQGNLHWQGCIMKHEVKDGNYGLMELSLKYLMKEWL